VKAPVETEIKLPVEDLDALRQELARSGARLEAARHRQDDALYDAGGRLERAGCALRLRRTPTGALLTYKGPATQTGGIKSRREIETTVEDAGAIDALLDALGFVAVFRYEKRRETWSFGGCEIALDETPIGSFIEIEGTPAAIASVLDRLGMDPTPAIPESYPALYARLRRAHPDWPRDMIFPEPPSGKAGP
jgi:adenylate cyclase, class 2